MSLYVGWASNRIPHCSSDGCAWLDVGYDVCSWLKESKKTHDHSTVDSYMYIHASRSSMRDIDNGCTFGIANEHTRKRVVVTYVTLLIVYSFSCDSFHCVLCKNSQFAIKRISHSKSDLQ